MIRLLISLPIFVSLLLSPVSAFAQTNGENAREEIQKRLEERKTEREERKASKSAQRQQKLTDVKLRVCQNRQEVIKNRSLNLADRGKRHYDTFTTFLNRVDNYYLNTLVPQSVNLENYEQLKADIQTQKTELEEAIETAKSTASNFSCENDNPKEDLQLYREDMQDVLEALKDYRESIKNFIKAVKEAVREGKTSTSSADN